MVHSDARRMHLTFEHAGVCACLQLVMEVMKKMEGAYALLIKSRHYPGEMVAAKRGSPMIVGIKEGKENKNKSGGGLTHRCDDVPAVASYACCPRRCDGYRPGHAQMHGCLATLEWRKSVKPDIAVSVSLTVLTVDVHARHACAVLLQECQHHAPA